MTDQEEIEELCAEASALAEQIKTSFLHLNNLRLLCELCEETDEKVQFQAMKETFQVLEHIMREKPEYHAAFVYKNSDKIDTPTTEKKAKAEDNENADEQISEFLNMKYTDFVDILISKHLGNKESSFQIPALKMLLRFLLLEHQISISALKKVKDPSVLLPVFNSTVQFIQTIISTILQGQKSKKSLILMSYPSLLEAIKEFFHNYDDLRFYMLKSITKLCKQKRNATNKDIVDKFVLNAFQLLHRMPTPTSIENFYVHDPEKFSLLASPPKKQAESFADLFQSGNKRKRKDAQIDDNQEALKQAALVFKVKEHSKAFQNAWRALLRLPLSSLVYKQILLDMPQHILPHFPNPELFGDFFKDAYKMGGMSSVLALHGLFVLVSKYNLEHKDFYKDLYALLEPSIFLVKYSGKFFDLCRLFFASSYLPEYLCAAFCKRLIRLGLKAPPPAYLPVLALVHNIMASHVQLVTLLHRPTKLSSDGILMVKEKKKESNREGEDPFNMDEPDPANCNAQQSSLWELKALRDHYYPVISRFCKTFEKPINEHRDLYEIKDFLNQTYESEFQTQITRKRKGKPVPLTFKCSGKLFSAEEHTESFPTWDFN